MQELLHLVVVSIQFSALDFYNKVLFQFKKSDVLFDSFE
ncbi:hypothetical protein LEP1GSC021_3552 [Leptospira noguchii str. 1993005606]|uniref:Uncharacterized protein n=2 Tax=Leptospira noguchii TaxID=28182 RepID=M6YCU1_9LEPT|nr:hypothetical protein LEP1GSC041_4596 [Leptospira noguchii str. 2006001870]EMI72637.1 hypothetical protein LEP1GSC072_0505 [Leptospira noguchii str. Bonito]EMN00254.1 hypothetical protein LEP1GSC035_4346 [Leptospira noguchii str. 2007001578]EMO28149.1 hypothetical protein LEP1GSC170_4333 [Leptospira interrogans serovar Bataviae str. HAI135]EMO87459.1 hypothetical protein LEP1GSC024_0936 [Leptospira noguchii str. 2001034031]EMS83577.1 hypothetical protein LEP1GSC074_3752 [Leptospira noguchii 